MMLKERERIIAISILVLLIVSWLGFLVHRSPRFAGSGIGTMFGIAGAFLLLVPLAYPLIKRVRYLNDRITSYVSMQSWMTMHVYAGIFGPLLGIIHSGHKFDSILGIMLTAVMLLVVVSGFVGRYLLSFVSQEIKDKLLLLQTARGDLDYAWGTLKESSSVQTMQPNLLVGLASLGIGFQSPGPSGQVYRIAESVADLEYAVRTHELLKHWCSRWLKLHLALSVALYLLLALHIGSGIYFGLRWLK